jgi:hypothetical protein
MSDTPGKDPWKEAANGDDQEAKQHAAKERDKDDEARAARVLGAAAGGSAGAQAAEAAANAKNGRSINSSSKGKNEQRIAGVSAEDAKALLRVALKKNPYLRVLKFVLPLALIFTPMMCAQVDVTDSQELEFVEGAASLIPEEHITAYQRAASKTGSLNETGVPWTLIAGVALSASRSGRYSPYDTCDRNPEAGALGSKPGYDSTSCEEEPSIAPSISPAIGAEDSPALGPFLIQAALVPEDLEVQSIQSRILTGESSPETAVDFVAVELRAARAQLEKEGWSFVASDPSTTAQSWVEAVRRIGVVDPNTTGGCVSPSFSAPPAATLTAEVQKHRADTAKGIQSTWQCYLSQVRLRTLGTSSITADPVELSQQAALSSAVSEALTVSWGFSKWGSTPPGCAADANGVLVLTVGNDAPAGVFPLTHEVFKKYSPDLATNPALSRCDLSANVRAAAAAFAAVESVVPGKKTDDVDRSDAKGKWNKAIGGWAVMPWALGNEVPRLVKEGPLTVESVRFTPTPDCTALIDSWLNTAAASLPPTSFYPSSPEFSETDGLVVAQYVAGNPAPSTPCAVAQNGMNTFNDLLAQKASVLGSTLWETSTPEPATTSGPATTPAPFTPDQQRASAYLSIGSWFSTRISDTVAPTPVDPVGGVNSLVPRLSLTGGMLTTCAEAPTKVGCLPAFPQPLPDRYAETVVTIARALGGITPRDTAHGLDITKILAPPVVGALAASGCLPAPVGAAIDNAIATYQEVLKQAGMPQAAKSVIPVEMILAQFGTESAYAVNRVDAAGWTGTKKGAGGPADVGTERAPDASPSTTKGIIGPRIGSGRADTDAGVIDGFANEDRAVGAVQFIPSTWTWMESKFGLLLDANKDGLVDPHNVYDEGLAAVLVFARNAAGEDLNVNTEKKMAVLAQYAGYGVPGSSTHNAAGFARYLAYRERTIAPMLKCLQDENGLINVPAPPLVPIGYSSADFDENGCPKKARPGTLGRSVANVNILDLCKKSLEGAPNEQTRTAIRFMFANLGAPYVNNINERMTDWKNDKAYVPGPNFRPALNVTRKFDCSSYVMRAFRAAGWATFSSGGGAPSSHALGPADGWSMKPWLDVISYNNALPGDILVVNQPQGGHVMMKLAGPYLIHTGGPAGSPSTIQPHPAPWYKGNPAQVIKVRRINPARIPLVTE